MLQRVRFLASIDYNMRVSVALFGKYFEKRSALCNFANKMSKFAAITLTYAYNTNFNK